MVLRYCIYLSLSNNLFMPVSMLSVISFKRSFVVVLSPQGVTPFKNFILYDLKFHIKKPPIVRRFDYCITIFKNVLPRLSTTDFDIDKYYDHNKKTHIPFRIPFSLDKLCALKKYCVQDDSFMIDYNYCSSSLARSGFQSNLYVSSMIQFLNGSSTPIIVFLVNICLISFILIFSPPERSTVFINLQVT